LRTLNINPGSPPTLTTTAQGAADRAVGADPVRLTAIPYYARANRDAGAMRVWIPAVSAPAPKVRQPQPVPTSQET
jgi:hypothetical protein